MKKHYWWITTSDKGHFSTLSIKDEYAEEESMKNNIHFESWEDANAFLDEFKAFILKSYPRAKGENWYSE